MRLVKYSAEPLVFDPEFVYPNSHIASAVGKPVGLWVSDESPGMFGWKEWCEGETWNIGGLAHRTEFALTPGHNVLIIDTPEALAAFDAEYSTGSKYIERIDWSVVAERYDGIIITPYQWEHRLSMMWYYGWDCASGCIWNLSAIAPVCGEVQNHGSITVTCTEPAGHEESEGRGRVHQGESYGVKVMWLPGESAREEVPIIPGGYTMTSVAPGAPNPD